MELALSLISILGVIIAIFVNVRTIEKSHDDTVRWQQQTDDNIKELTRRVDEHNSYAQMFQKSAEDIAFIKGKLEG